MSFMTRLTARVLLTGVLLSLAASPAAASIFTVDTEGDGPDAAPGDRRCVATGPPGVAGRCTLRAAIQESNAFFDPDQRIVLPAGRYLLTFDMVKDIPVTSS